MNLYSGKIHKGFLSPGHERGVYRDFCGKMIRWYKELNFWGIYLIEQMKIIHKNVNFNIFLDSFIVIYFSMLH